MLMDFLIFLWYVEEKEIERLYATPNKPII
jgi:hypothetical protein